MYEYADYASELTALALEVGDSPGREGIAVDRERALSTGPMTQLRKTRSIERLRAGGTFFTGPDLSARLWARALADLGPGCSVVDPAVGAGDLLLPPARALHAQGIDGWPAMISGMDIDDAFVKIARTRLRLATNPRLTDPEFGGVRVHDFFAGVASEITTATHVVMNPPFVKTVLEHDPHWPNVSVNAAAIFVERCAAAMQPGARLLAVLPDVLRSGSRYEQWRERIAGMSSSIDLEELGQFDAETDVHVFILDLTISENRTNCGWPRVTIWSGDTVADHFTIRVGSVVPHRHPDSGARVPYARVADVQPWGEFDNFIQVRGYRGRTDEGPFVLVRRTSRPGDNHRAQASLYIGSAQVAVENHFLVLKPAIGGIEKCRNLMKVLRDPRTSAHLDRAIRLRHLTVGALGSVPWGET